MKVHFTLSLVFLLFINLVFSQKQGSEVLFTVADTPVTVKEFLRVYKKNLDLVQDPSQKEVDAYLELYINYHLKLQEARRLGLHQEVSYQREFTNYKNQLINNYLTDSKVTDKLVREAYDRISEDIHAVHILVKLDPTVSDTTSVYQRLIELRERLKNEDFVTLQSQLHNGTDVYVEDLGYFTGFRMVYPFETAAYNTQVGEVSLPFRTRFGYHIVKVLDRRPARGQVTVSHIMVSNRQEDSTIVPEERIKEIYRQYLQNGNFESLANQFSDDKGSADKGGLLAPFEGGQLASQKFEEVAFSLEKIGEVSQPFESQFGWHIIRLEDKQPLGSYEDMEAELQVKVRRDSRSDIISSALMENLKEKYKINIDDQQIEYFKSILSPAYFERGWKLPDDFKVDTKLGSIENFTLTNQAFGQHLLRNQNNYYKKQLSAQEVVDYEFNNFLEEQVLGYHKDNLENVNEDFAFVLREYRDGLLLFDLMEKEIWNVAMTDSIGLAKYFEENRNLYSWPKRFKGTVFSASEKTHLEPIKEQLNNGAKVDQIVSKLNSSNPRNIIKTTGTFDDEHSLISAEYDFKVGVSKIYSVDDSFVLYTVSEVLPAVPKTLDEARGKVMSDYQNYMEQQWLKDLRKRYPVKVNGNVLEVVKQKLNDLGD